MSVPFWTDDERQTAEEYWLSSKDPEDLLRGSLDGIEEERGVRFKRKLRLFAVECLRRISHLFRDSRSRGWIEILEQNADGTISDKRQDCLGTEVVDPPNDDHFQGDDPIVSQVACAWQALCLASDPDFRPFDANCVACWARDALYPIAGPLDLTDEKRVQHNKHQEEIQVALLRDIFGNPFRPVTLDPSWLIPKVKTLAQAIYDERAFERMPELADALAEAGCSNQDILSHCRGPGPHVRGCWVVDLLLGKE